jgi:predicted Zn-ribbon and HTH transcriptional regulator
MILLMSFLVVGKERLGVFELKPLNISPDLASIVSDKIAFEFQQLEEFELVERQEITQVLKEQKFQASGVTDTMVEIGKIMNIETMVLGSFGQLDKSTWFISLKLVGIETGKVKSNYYTVEGSFKDFVMKAPSICVSELISGKMKKKVVQIPEEKASSAHVEVIQYIQKEHPHGKMFIPCAYCGGRGTIFQKLGSITSPHRCPMCQGFKYSGPETNYKLVAGKFETF